MSTCTSYHAKIERQTSLPLISAGQDALNLSKGETYAFDDEDAPKPFPLEEDEKAEILIVQ